MKPIVSAAGILLLVAACATNPVTGKREFNVVSERQEIALGAQAHQQVIQEFGVYTEKPELTSLVERLGQEIAMASDRPDIRWTFTVLDTPMVNAMALPGGYIYVTRGILAHMNSEDELASVIAHEVAHVAARHSAQRISQAQLAQLGLVLGSVLAGPQATQAYGGLAELAAGLLFQRYSRQQETQADLLGTAYMTEAGHNPRGAESMLETLRRLDRGRSSGINAYFQNHPDPAKRVNDVQRKIAELQGQVPAVTASRLDRTPYVRLLDGVIVGDSTQEVVVRDNTVFHKSLGIVAPVPPGWNVAVGSGAVFQMVDTRHQNNAFIMQELEARRLQGRNAQDAVRRLLSANGFRYVASTQGALRSGERLAVDLWSAGRGQQQVAVETAQFAAGDKVVVLLRVSPGVGSNRSPLVSTLNSIAYDPGRARSAQPERMAVRSSNGISTWQEAARAATGNPADAEVIAIMNGFDPGSRVPQGVMLKLPADLPDAASRS